MKLKYVITLFIFSWLLCSCISDKDPEQTIETTNKITNPILPGFYPDPSITRHGDDYYLTTSTFSYFPGLPIFHSKDLVSWKQIGHAMDRPDQLPLGTSGVSRGLFAPAISSYKDKFYIVNTLIDIGGNYVITADSAAGPWSNPYYLPNVDGIDPSLYFDEDTDEAYIIYNSIPPDNKSLYGGHRTIRMRSFDYTNMVAGDDEIILVNGGVDITREPVWIEAPHIFKRNNYYYLICAEGGTGYNHSEVVFRSEDVKGPYIPNENNPILTQRDIHNPRDFQVTTTGHADFVEFGDGSWWAVFLATRPYGNPAEDYYNIGRETFLAPVIWENDWPHILPPGELLPESYEIARLPGASEPQLSPIQLAHYHTEFADNILGMEWVFLRNPAEGFYSISDGKLMIKAASKKLTASTSPNAVFFRLQYLSGTAETEMCFENRNSGDLAGMTIFQNEKNFYLIAKYKKENDTYIGVLRPQAADGELQVLAENKLNEGDDCLSLQMKTDGKTFNFFYKPTSDDEFILLAEDLDGTYLSTKVARGFVGSMIGLYAYSNENTGIASFESFSSIKKGN